MALYAAQGIHTLSPLIVIPYLTRVLGPSNYGSLAFFQSLIAYGLVVLNFGFYVSGVRDASRYRSDPALLGAKIKCVVATKCVLLSVAFVGMVIAALVVPVVRERAVLFFVCGLQLVGNITLPTWLFQGIEESHRLLVPETVSRLLMTALIFIFVRHKDQVALAAFFISSADILSGVIVWKSVKQVACLKGSRISWSDIRRALSDDLSLFAISVGSNLYTLFNPLLIEIFYGPVWVAYYAISLRIATAITKITGPLVQAVSPKLAVLVVEDMARATRLLLKSGLALTIMTTALGLLTLIFAPTVLAIVAGHKYIGAARVLQVFSPLSLVMVLGALVGQNFAVHIGLLRAVARIYWIIGVMTVILMVPAVRFYGAIGSAGAVVIAETLVVVSILTGIMRWHKTVSRAYPA